MAKEPEEETSSGHENIRRVYALPAEMVERITEFQNEKGLASEVEAVRRLIDEALKSRDNLEKIINRFISKLANIRLSSDVARDVLVGHPLVRIVEFDGDAVIFSLKDRTGARIDESGDVWIRGLPEHLVWIPDKPGKFSTGSIEDKDAIPF